jgi:hypothetical protein
MKFNTDEAYNKGRWKRIRAIGYRVDDVVGGFAKKLDICSAYVAELWRVLEG